MAIYNESITGAATGTGDVSPSTILQNAITGACVADSELDGIRIVLASISEAASGSASFLGNMTMDEAITAAVTASSSYSVGVLFSEALDGSAIGSSSMSSNAIFNVSIEEILQCRAVFNIAGETYEGWVFEGNSFAASRYKGFNFNSFFEHQGSYYGCGDGGIYELSGEDDDGIVIDAFFQTGNIKPFANSMSRVPDAYLIIKNDGIMQVRVISNQGDIYTYRLTQYHESHDEARVKLGKGQKSVLWQFILSNENGCDFDVESMKIYPLELTRRV